MDNKPDDIMRRMAEAVARVPPPPDSKWEDRILLGCWAVSLSRFSNEALLMCIGQIHTTMSQVLSWLPYHKYRLLNTILSAILRGPELLIQHITGIACITGRPQIHQGCQSARSSNLLVDCQQRGKHGLVHPTKS